MIQIYIHILCSKHFSFHHSSPTHPQTTHITLPPLSFNRNKVWSLYTHSRTSPNALLLQLRGVLRWMCFHVDVWDSKCGTIAELKRAMFVGKCMLAHDNRRLIRWICAHQLSSDTWKERSRFRFRSPPKIYRRISIACSFWLSDILTNMNLKFTYFETNRRSIVLCANMTILDTTFIWKHINNVI